MEKFLEVDLGKLQNNVRVLTKYIPVPIMAVLKNNGYGMGAVTAAKLFEQSGVNFFAVSSTKEGVELRKAGISSPILVFAPVFSLPEELANLWNFKLTPSVYSLQAAEALDSWAMNHGRQINAHVKVDTGMGRMGFSPQELINSAEKLREMKGVFWQGIFTHYSNAFEARFNYTKKQKTRFLDLVKDLKKIGINIPVKYSANSSAALKFPDTHMDMVSIGSAFLGTMRVNPDLPLEKVYRLKAVILQIKSLPKGSYVGYSNTYKTKKPTKIAILPIGYADGFGVHKKIDSFRVRDYLREQYLLMKSFVMPANTVFFKGQALKVIGKIGMQLTVVDIGSLPLKPGDMVEISANPLLLGSSIERVYVGSAAGGQRELKKNAGTLGWAG